MVCVCCLGGRLLSSKANIASIDPNGERIRSVEDLIAIVQCIASAANF